MSKHLCQIEIETMVKVAKSQKKLVIVIYQLSAIKLVIGREVVLSMGKGGVQPKRLPAHWAPFPWPIITFAKYLFQHLPPVPL